jgi:ATP-dependent Clp protease ATP-binding subunit ClpB
MEIDSMPAELDEITRRIKQLEIERVALQKEKDDASRERLSRLDKELADLKEKSNALTAKWKQEKEVIAQSRALKEERENALLQLERAERESNLEEAARLKYGTLAEIDKKMQAQTARLAEIQKSGSLLKEEVDEEDIAEVVAKWTGIPVSRLMEGEVQKLLRMEERLRQRVVGQEDGIRAVANAVRRARAGLQDPKRPIGSFIFLGPTGVGKTELARALAEFLFDDENAMIRIDMSEYQEKHTVARLIGAPPGYVGYEEGGQLTEAVRRRAYSVVLFDEIEKAHPDVFNTLLQILDDGRLTDGQGRTVDFKNTVLIMTSNVGTEFLSNGFSTDDPNVRGSMMDALRARFRPEFLNRIDEIVLFHPLAREHLKRIVDIQMEQVHKRMAERHIEIELTDAAKEYLVNEGYDATYGARPLKRTIQRLILDPLALQVLEGKFADGDTVIVNLEKGKIVFYKEEKRTKKKAA